MLQTINLSFPQTDWWGAFHIAFKRNLTVQIRPRYLGRDFFTEIILLIIDFLAYQTPGSKLGVVRSHCKCNAIARNAFRHIIS